MYAEKKKHYEARAKVPKALSHPSRLYIIEELQKEDTLCLRSDRHDWCGYVHGVQTSTHPQACWDCC